MNAGDRDQRRGLAPSLWRYGVVGLGQNAVSYALSLGLLRLDLTPVTAMAIIVPLSAVASFLLNRSWSFRVGSQRYLRFSRYLLTWAVIYPFALLVAWIATLLHLPPWLCNLLPIIACAVPLFLLMRYWVFASGRTPST